MAARCETCSHAVFPPVGIGKFKSKKTTYCGKCDIRNQNITKNTRCECYRDKD